MGLASAKLKSSRLARQVRLLCSPAMDDARTVRDFWFGKLPLSPEQLNRRMQLWFGGDSVSGIVNGDTRIRCEGDEDHHSGASASDSRTVRP